MSRRRRLLRIVLGGGSALIGLSLAGVIGGSIWLTTPGGNDFLRGLLEDQVSQLMPLGELRIGKLQTDLFTHIELSDVTLHRWDDETLLTVPFARLEHELPALGERSMTLRSLEITSPALRLEQLEDGQIDLLVAFGVTDEPSADPPSAWGGLDELVILEEAILSDGRLTWVSGEEKQEVESISLQTSLTLGHGKRAAIEDTRIHVEPVGYAPIDLTGALRYDTGNVLIDSLALSYDQSKVAIAGSIHQVELDMALGLQVSVEPLAAGQLSQWTEDQTPAMELEAELDVRGPLSEIAISGALSSAVGELGLTGAVDVTADPMTWSLTTQTDRLDLDALLPSVTEPVRLAGTYQVSGAGTQWPGGIVARIDVDAGEQILWGEPVSSVRLGADLSGGRLTIESLTAQHPTAALGLTGGWIDLIEEKASLQTDVSMPTLAELANHALPGYLGSLTATGPVEVDWSADPVRVDIFPVLDGNRIRGAGFSVDRIRSEGLQVSLLGEQVEFRGAVWAEMLTTAGLEIDRIDLTELAGAWNAASGVRFDTQLQMGRLLVGNGTFELSGLSGPIGGSVPPQGEPEIDSELVLGELTLLPAAYKIDGGPVSLKLRENGVQVDLSLSREDRVVVQAQTFGDLETGQWRVEELALFPTSSRGVVSLSQIPIKFTLNENGVDDLELILIISDDPTSVHTSKDDAAFISMAGGTAGDEPDLKLEVQRLPLPWLTDVLNTFLSEDGLPFIAPLEGLLDGEVSLKGLSSEADLSGSVNLTKFSWPGQVHNVDLSANLRGQLGRPGTDLRLSDSEGLLFALDGAVPLDIEGASLDCTQDIALRGLLAPGELNRLATAFPAAGGLTGLGSADFHLTGPVCDPRLVFVGALSMPIGGNGEHMRVDLHLDRDGDAVEIDATVDEALMRRFQLSGGVDTPITSVLDWAVNGVGPEPDLADPATWISGVSLNLIPLAVPMESLTTLFGLPGGLSGRLAGGITLMGSLEQPKISGGLLWLEGRVGDVPLQVANLSVFPEQNSETGNDGYHLTGSLDFGDRGNLAIDGFVPLTLARIREEDALTEDDLYLRVEGDGVPLEVLNGVVDGVSDAAGQFSVSGTIKGAINEPKPDLNFTLAEGALVYRPLDIRYTNLNLDLALRNDHLIFREATLSSEPRLNALGSINLGRPPGILSARGNMKMSGFTPRRIALDLTAEDFWLSATNDYNAAVRGELMIRGAWPAVAISGDVAITEGRFVFDDTFFLGEQSLALDPMITIYRRDEVLQTEAVVEAPSEFASQLSVDLNLDLNRNLRMEVDMPLLDTYGGQISSLSTVSVIAELDGGLDLTYGSGALSINGTVEMMSGSTTRLFDTTFAVSPRSAVYFVGKDYANPILQMDAIHTNARYGDVNVAISGTADDPEVGLSAANYDETDILFLLLFGKPASEMAQGESDTSQLLITTALASLSGQVTRGLGGSIVDEIDWDPESGFRVGKALSEKLFVAYDRNTSAEGDENINQLTLEWLITRRMYAEFMTGDRDQSSADMYWRWLF